MSTVVITTEKNGKNELTKGTVENVIFAYTKLQEGAFAYGSKVDKEYATDFILSEDQADDWKDAFPKNGVKEIKTAEFETKYKFPAPYPDQRKQYVAKLKVGTKVTKDYPKQALVKGEDDIPYEWPNRPKAFIPVEGGVEDITMTKLIGNGSKGTVKFNVTNHPTYGKFPKLIGMLITDLVMYESTASSGAVSEFGSVVGGYKQGDGTTMQRADVNNYEPEEEEDDPTEPADDESDERPF